MRIILYSILLCCLVHNAAAQCNAIITPLSTTTFCQGGSVTFVGSAGDLYKWHLNGNLVAVLTTDTFTVNTAGSYTVVIDSAGCIDTSAAVVVTVNAIPAQPGPISGDTIACHGSTQTYTIAAVPGATSYQWYGGSGWNWQSFAGTTTTPSRTATIGGSNTYSSPATTISVVAVNSCGSSAPSYLYFQVYNPPTLGGMNPHPDNSVNQIPVCPGIGAALYANWHSYTSMGYEGAMSYQWSRNGTPIPGAVGQWLSLSKGGTYVVTIYNPGCSVSDIKLVHQSCPVPSITQDTATACIDGAVILNTSLDFDGYNGASYLWSGWAYNGVSIPGTYGLQKLVATDPGNYTVSLNGHKVTNSGDWTCNVTSAISVVIQSGNQATPVSIIQNGNDFIATSGFVSYQWYKNNNLISGATNSTFTKTTWGDYFVLATDGNGCLSKSNVVLEVSNVTAENQKLEIYPNPNTGYFTLSANIPAENKVATIAVTDISGRIIMNKSISVKNGLVEEEIELNDIAPGLYFLKLSSEHYNKVSTFVKQ